jgi:hypothetical protein
MALASAKGVAPRDGRPARQRTSAACFSTLFRACRSMNSKPRLPRMRLSAHPTLPQPAGRNVRSESVRVEHGGGDHPRARPLIAAALPDELRGAGPTLGDLGVVSALVVYDELALSHVRPDLGPPHREVLLGDLDPPAPVRQTSRLSLRISATSDANETFGRLISAFPVLQSAFALPAVVAVGSMKRMRQGRRHSGSC